MILVNVLMRTMDFLAFVTRLISEDIMWLRDYLRTLTDGQCLGFFALCLLYIVIMKVIRFLAGQFIKCTGADSDFWENLSFKLQASNPKYVMGYEIGYRAGEEARREADKPSWWQRTKLNPFNWFK